MYTRTCKVCSMLISYKNKYNYKKAELVEASCKICSSRSNGHNNKGKKRSEEFIEALKSRSIAYNKKRKTGEDVKCCECGAVFYKSGWQLNKKIKSYCSKKCANKGHSKLLLKHPLGELECAYCTKVFRQNKYTQKYCSAKCSSRHNLKTINSTQPKKSNTNPELAFKEVLEVHNIDYVFQKSVSWKKGWKKWYDFYIPSHNLLIEIDGVYWHGKGIEVGNLNKQQWKTKVNDRLKNILAKSRGFNMLRIWSDEINTLNLKETLKRYE